MQPQNPPDQPSINQSTIVSTASIATVITPEGLGIRIDNVNKSMWHYIRQRKLLQFIVLMPVVILWEIAGIFLLVAYFHEPSHTNDDSRGPIYFLFIPYIIFSAWWYRVKLKFESAFLEEFALSNGYIFAKQAAIDQTYGTLFRVDAIHSVSDIVSGQYGSNSMRLFLHNLKVYRNNYQTTVLEINVEGQLPGMLLLSKKFRYEGYYLKKYFSTKNTISLEGDFNQYFTLYGQQGNEIEIREVFSPDTMALLEDYAKHFSVEFAGNRIYIYKHGYVSNSKDITVLFALARKLTDKIGPLSERLQYDAELLPTPVNNIAARKSWQFMAPWKIQLLGIGFGILLTLIIVAGFLIAGVPLKPQSSTTSDPEKPKLIGVIHLPSSSSNSISNKNSAVNPSPTPSSTPSPAGDSATIRAAGDDSSTTNTPEHFSNMADVTAYAWLYDTQQHEFSTAYAAEDNDFKAQYSVVQQSSMYANIFPSQYVAPYDSEVSGVHQGNQMIANVHKVINPSKPSVPPTYVEIYIQNENGVVYVWGEKDSTLPLTPSIPE